MMTQRHRVDAWRPRSVPGVWLLRPPIFHTLLSVPAHGHEQLLSTALVGGEPSGVLRPGSDDRDEAGRSASPWGDRPLAREDILDAGQVAELLGLRRSTIEDYARRGLLPVVRLGRHRRYLRADVERFILGARHC